MYPGAKIQPKFNPYPLTRGTVWLQSRLDYLWENFFSDIDKVNPVKIGFGRFSKFRLGSIKMDPQTKISYITITSMFRDTKIPVEVVDQTIAHELCHYTHGFSSARERAHDKPHSGGVIKKELSERGLLFLYLAYSEWVKTYKKSFQNRWQIYGRVITIWFFRNVL